MLITNGLGRMPRPRLQLVLLKNLVVVLLTGQLCILATAGMSRGESWDQTIADAKREGELVVVLGGAASRTYRPIFKIFEQKFGIRMVVSTGSGRRQADRLLAERGARRYKVDVFMVGPTTGNRRLIPHGVADPMAPELFLPEVVDRSLWYKGKHYYSDPEEKYIFAFAGGADLTPVAMRFNTEKLPIDEAKRIDSVWKFLNPKRFGGQIVALSPMIAGAGGSMFTVQVHPDLGEAYLRRFFSRELNVTFLRDYRQVADGVARGKFTMAIFVGTAGRDIDRLGEQGLPVANFGEVIEGPLKERPTLQGTGSSNNIMIVNRRPHPAATRLFINWFLSKEGQTLRHTKSEGAPSQSFRVDVTEMGKVHKSDLRKPGVDYLTFAHDPVAQRQRIKMLRRAEKLFVKARGR